jgi:hypothetical protein
MMITGPRHLARRHTLQIQRPAQVHHSRAPALADLAHAGNGRQLSKEIENLQQKKRGEGEGKVHRPKPEHNDRDNRAPTGKKP